MKILKNGQETDYSELDKDIANYFSSHYHKDTFTVIPNSKGYLSNLDWYSLLAQAEANSFEGIIEYYEKDFKETIKIENKELKDLVPQLFKLLDFLKHNNYQIG